MAVAGVRRLRLRGRMVRMVLRRRGRLVVLRMRMRRLMRRVAVVIAKED